MLTWIFRRCEGTGKAHDTPVGLIPAAEDLSLDGLELSQEDLSVLLGVDTDGWLEEIPKLREYYATFGDRLPAEISEQLDSMEQALKDNR